MPAARSSTGTRRPARVWLQRVLAAMAERGLAQSRRAEKHWGYTHSIGMIREIFADRMYPLTLAGLERRDEGAFTKALSASERRHLAFAAGRLTRHYISAARPSNQ